MKDSRDVRAGGVEEAEEGESVKMRRNDSVAFREEEKVSLPVEDTEKELAKYRAMFDIITRLNTKGDTSHAVHELVNSVYALLNVRVVVVYLISCGEQDEEKSSHSSHPRIGCEVTANQQGKVLYPVIANHSEQIDDFSEELPVTDNPLQSLAGFVACTGQTVSVNRIQYAVGCGKIDSKDPVAQYKNAVLVPVTFGAEGYTVGVLQCVDKANGAQSFTDVDVSMLEAIAANAGNVLHKLVLYDTALAAQRKTSALLDLASVSRHIREDSHIHLPNLIERLMMSVYKIMRADRVSLYLCDSSKRELWCCISKDYKGSRIPYGTGIIGTVANNCEMLNIRDCYQDRRFNRRGDAVTGYNTRSMLAAPVTSSAGNLVAVLVVINKIALKGSNEPIIPPLSDTDRIDTSSERPPPFKREESIGESSAIQGFSSEDFENSAVDPNCVAGITYFSREDEVVLESVSVEVGNILERNALDTHYENVISEVLGERRRDYSKILTASLLAETTTSESFQGDVAGLAQRRTSLLLRSNRSKATILNFVCKWWVFFRAVGHFARALKRTRGFQFCVKNLDEGCYSSRRSNSTNDNVKRIKMLARKFPSSDILEHVGTKICPGAQYIMDIDVDPSALEASRERLEESRDWCLNVFDMDVQHTIGIFSHGLEYLGLIDRFSMSKSTVLSFGYGIRDSYLSRTTCPYHNWEHAFAVFQMSFAFLCKTKLSSILTPVDQLGLLIGAVGHDAGHEGRNNDFEIKVGSDLAIRYNDNSVLEQYHSALLFQILKRPGNNILHFTSRTIQVEFRKVTVSSILATDMSAHFDHVKKVSNRLSTVNPSSENQITDVYDSSVVQDRLELTSFVLHSIDIGGQCYPHEQSQEWSSRLLQEFIAQAKDEIQFGFQPAPYMVGLDQPLRQAVLQKSFTENIVMPAWVLMRKMFPECSPLLANLQANVSFYAQQAESCQTDQGSKSLSTQSA